MTPLEFNLPSHDADALSLLQKAIASSPRTRRDIPIHISELDWTTAWNDLVRVALYKDGAEVSEIGSTWVGSFVGMDALRPFTAAEINRMGRADAFLSSAWQNGSLLGDDQLWAIPWLSDTRVIFYWRDMLEHAGIDETAAFLTFDQMDRTLDCLRSQGINTPWAVTTRRTSNTLYNISSWVWGAGGDFMCADGKCMRVAEAEALAGMTRYFNLYRYMPQRSEPSDSLAVFELFQNQSIAAMVSGPWFLKWLRQHGVPPYTLSRIGVSLLPGPSFVGGTNLVVWKHVAADHEQAAVDLVHYLVTNPALLEFYHQAGLLPARRDLLSQPPFSSEPHYQKIREALETGRPHSRIAMWGLVEDRLVMTLAQIWSDIRANPTGDIAALVASYMKPLAQRLDAILAARH